MYFLKDVIIFNALCFCVGLSTRVPTEVGVLSPRGLGSREAVGCWTGCWEPSSGPVLSGSYLTAEPAICTAQGLEPLLWASQPSQLLGYVSVFVRSLDP